MDRLGRLIASRRFIYGIVVKCPLINSSRYLICYPGETLERKYPKYTPNLCQMRFAGHSKWQNIKSTKQANDNYKSKLFSRYATMARLAIVHNNLQTDPKINKALADVLAEATKFNVPRATMDRAIQRAANVKIEQKLIEVIGPGGSVIILRCETDNYGRLRRDVKKKMKSFTSAQLVGEDKMINLFCEKGYVRITDRTLDNKKIDSDAAEEAAIMANAEDFSLEENDDPEDTGPSRQWIFTTEADKVNHCKVYLARNNFNVVSDYTEYVPYRRIAIPGDQYDETEELIRVLRELPEVVDSYHNVSRSE